jgi:hypothetical protein
MYPRLVSMAFLGVVIAYGGDYAGRYRDQLNNLDATRPESVCEARTMLRSWMPQADPGDRADMFRAFRASYLASISSTGPRFSEAMQPFSGEILDWLSKSESVEAVQKLMERNQNIRRAAAPWLGCGFSIAAAEGTLYPKIDPAALSEFAVPLPPDLASYIRFREREDAQDLVGDACLQLSWEQLRERLVRWEALASSYAQLPETASEVQPEIRRLAGFYFFGVDNTPTYEFRTGRIEVALVASWGRLAALGRESRYAGLAAALVPRLKEQDGRITEGELSLFERFGLGAEFGLWWRWFQFRMNNVPRG